MNRPRDYHIKSDTERQVLKKKKEKQVLYDRELICGILKSYKWTYLQNRNKTTDVENKHGCQGEV